MPPNEFHERIACVKGVFLVALNRTAGHLFERFLRHVLTLKPIHIVDCNELMGAPNANRDPLEPSVAVQRLYGQVTFLVAATDGCFSRRVDAANRLVKSLAVQYVTGCKKRFYRWHIQS